MNWLLMFFSYVFFSAVYVAVLGAVSLALKIPVKSISIGRGVRLFNKTIDDWQLQFGLIPVGGYVEFLNDEVYQHQPLRNSVTSHGSAALLLLLIGHLLIGSGQFEHILSFEEFFAVAFNPKAFGMNWFKQFYESFGLNLSCCIGVVAVNVVIFNIIGALFEFVALVVGKLTGFRGFCYGLLVWSWFILMVGIVVGWAIAIFLAVLF